MSDYEINKPETSASQGDLQEVFLRTAGWLERNGTLVMEPGEVLGERDGLPITSGLPRLQFTIPGDLIRQYDPKAREDLEVGEELTLVYWKAHYAPDEQIDDWAAGDLTEKPAKCEFVIEKQAPELDSESLTIEGDPKQEETLESDRFIIKAIPPAPEARSMTPEQLIAYTLDIPGRRASIESGSNTITFREYKAITEILDSLDLIKQDLDPSAV